MKIILSQPTFNIFMNKKINSLYGLGTKSDCYPFCSLQIHAWSPDCIPPDCISVTNMTAAHQVDTDTAFMALSQTLSVSQHIAQ